MGSVACSAVVFILKSEVQFQLAYSD